MDTGNITKPLKPLTWYKNLDSLKGRAESGAFLIEGERAVRQIADHHGTEIVEILATLEMASIIPGFPVRQLTSKQIASICSTKTPQGIMAVVRLPLDSYSAKLPENPGPKILLLEHVQDPGNVGTIIRTAAAFGFSGIIMSGKTADPFSAKAIQSTAGSVLSLWIRRTESYTSLAQSLSGQGYKIVAADLNGTSTAGLLPGIPRVVLALGNEASGLSATVIQMADYRVKIPIDRSKSESLNVAVSGAILMYFALS